MKLMLVILCQTGNRSCVLYLCVALVYFCFPCPHICHSCHICIWWFLLECDTFCVVLENNFPNFTHSIFLLNNTIFFCFCHLNSMFGTHCNIQIDVIRKKFVWSPLFKWHSFQLSGICQENFVTISKPPLLLCHIWESKLHFSNKISHMEDHWFSPCVRIVAAILKKWPRGLGACSLKMPHCYLFVGVQCSPKERRRTKLTSLFITYSESWMSWRHLHTKTRTYFKKNICQQLF